MATEPEMFDLLRRRFAREGNGGAGEYALMAQVRNAAGFGATRTFDAVSVSLWPSRGIVIHVYEIKCSRSDWLRELKDPAKADAAAKVADHFSVVVSDPKIVADGELPATWGLLVKRGEKLVCVKEAPLLPDADIARPVPRSFLVPMLRASGLVPLVKAPEIEEARSRGFEDGAKRWKEAYDKAQESMIQFRDTINAFENAAGVSLRGWAGNDPAAVGAALRSVLQEDKAVNRSREQIERAHRTLVEAAADLEKFLVREPA